MGYETDMANSGEKSVIQVEERRLREILSSEKAAKFVGAAFSVGLPITICLSWFQGVVATDSPKPQSAATLHLSVEHTVEILAQPIMRNAVAITTPTRVATPNGSNSLLNIVETATPTAIPSPTEANLSVDVRKLPELKDAILVPGIISPLNSNVNIRSGPVISPNNVVGMLTQGSTLGVDGITADDKWYFAIDNDGSVKYISSGVVSFQEVANLPHAEATTEPLSTNPATPTPTTAATVSASTALTVVTDGGSDQIVDRPVPVIEITKYAKQLITDTFLTERSAGGGKTIAELLAGSTVVFANPKPQQEGNSVRVLVYGNDGVIQGWIPLSSMDTTPISEQALTVPDYVTINKAKVAAAETAERQRAMDIKFDTIIPGIDISDGYDLETLRAKLTTELARELRKTKHKILVDGKYISAASVSEDEILNMLSAGQLQLEALYPPERAYQSIESGPNEIGPPRDNTSINFHARYAINGAPETANVGDITLVVSTVGLLNQVEQALIHEPESLISDPNVARLAAYFAANSEDPRYTIWLDIEGQRMGFNLIVNKETNGLIALAFALEKDPRTNHVPMWERAITPMSMALASILFGDESTESLAETHASTLYLELNLLQEKYHFIDPFLISLK